MGKDKKDKKGIGDIGSFKTKDTLREEDVELTKQVRNLEKRYKELYKSVHELSGTYQNCKEHFALTRYGDLKDMIKACVCDEVMQNAAKYSVAQNPEEKGRAVSLHQAAKQLSSGLSESTARDGRYTGNTEEETKRVSLLQAAKQFSDLSTATTTAIDEVSKLHKAEIVKDIEEKKKKIDQIEKKFLRLHNRLGKLKRDYEESKQHIPTRRYLVMKEIIKPLIRDEGLKVEA